jgi:hypothetical protein
MVRRYSEEKEDNAPLWSRFPHVILRPIVLNVFIPRYFQLVHQLSQSAYI